MLTVISPSKRLDLTPVDMSDATDPAFQKDALALARTARKLSAADLQKLMSISEPLAKLNVERLKAFAADPSEDLVKPAALAFDGDTYQGLEAGTLDAADIACHRVLTLDDLHKNAEIHQVNNEAADEQAKGSTEFFYRENHPCGKPVTFLAPTWVRVGENQSYKRLTPSPYYGQHTKEILAELGYTEKEITELIRIKVSHEYLPGMGSKDSYFLETKKFYENPKGKTHEK